MKEKTGIDDEWIQRSLVSQQQQQRGPEVWLIHSINILHAIIKSFILKF